MAIKYVPDGSWLRCSMGAMPQQLRVTHHNNTQIYGSPLASEADKDPFINIPSMGYCQVSCSVCVPAPIYWDKTAQGVRVNGYKLLVDEAKLQCSLGGQVSIFFSRAAAMGVENPLEVQMLMMADGNAPAPFNPASPLGNGLMGAGVGTGMGSQYLGNRFGGLASEANQFNFNSTPAPSNALRGNFGELRTTADLRMRGYDVVSTTQAGTLQGQGHQGLDIAARDPHGPTDILADAKFKSTPGAPQMSTTRGTGRQMSDRWLTSGRNNSRIYQAMSPADAARMTGKVNSGSSDLLRLAAKVDANGTVSYYGLDANGRTLAQTTLPAANVVGGSSRASNFINNTARSIQSTRAISGANTWLVRNANTVAKAGRVLGRATLVIGIATELYNIHSAYEADGGQVGTNTKQAVGTAVGGLGGAWAGAQLGATIGAIGGPVGIIAGGIIGGIAGGLIGGWAGGKVGSWF
ncbi:PAAR-like protein [uncultured Fibrella sp.]|uniref:PAAR-like protein n=1 Tax=uncultured Fibrella sp. TaxID=1284596 RepID=UPI0035C9E4C1